MVELKEGIDRQKSLLEIFRSQTEEQLASRRHAMELQIQSLDAQIAHWTASALETSQKMADYKAIKERIQRLQTMYDNLLTSDRTVAVEKQINRESVTILHRPQRRRPFPGTCQGSFPSPAIMGIVLGGIILVVLRRLDDRPHSLTEMRELFNERYWDKFRMSGSRTRRWAFPF